MAKIYNAPKPEYSSWEWFKYIAVRTIFPPVLLWDLTKIGANKLLGETVGNLILPAQTINFDALEVTDANVGRYNNTNLTCEKHEVITQDGVHLDTFEVKHASQSTIEPKYQKYIISFVGNASCFEDNIDEMKEDAYALQANVVGFNFRGVGKSTSKAKSKDELVADGVAQVQRILDQGVSPQNIILKGHSLGAGVASLVAQHFHQIDKPVNIFNSRSFSSISNFLIGNIRLDRDVNRHAIGQKETFGGKILGWFIKPLVMMVVGLANWEINAGTAFKNIPDAYKDYIVVRSRKEIRDERIDDAVIPHYASIHKELTSDRRAKKAAIDAQIVHLNDKIQKAEPSTIPDLISAQEKLVHAREKVKSDNKMETMWKYHDGHNSDWGLLHNRSGKSAQAFFRDFVQRTEEDHAVKKTPEMN